MITLDDPRINIALITQLNKHSYSMLNAPQYIRKILILWGFNWLYVTLLCLSKLFFLLLMTETTKLLDDILFHPIAHYHSCTHIIIISTNFFRSFAHTYMPCMFSCSKEFQWNLENNVKILFRKKNDTTSPVDKNKDNLCGYKLFIFVFRNISFFTERNTEGARGI